MSLSQFKNSQIFKLKLRFLVELCIGHPLGTGGWAVAVGALAVVVAGNCSDSGGAVVVGGDAQ